MIELINDNLKVSIAEKGAELQAVTAVATGINYMWNGDPRFWGRHSPVLFPIVGGLKNNSYQYGGKTYKLGRHGFARDLDFTVIKKTKESVLFGLTENETTLKVYPFSFQFFIEYTLSGDTLSILYKVKNTNKEDLLFSVGAHPAFNVPLVKGTQFDDYYLQFDQKENAAVYPLSESGQIEEKSVPFFHHSDRIDLHKSLFYKDALVFKELRSSAVSLQSDKTPHGLTVSFPGFPYLGIWGARDADFVCIEPWNGIADSVAASGKLEEKEGIISLQHGQLFDAAWSVRFF